MCLDTVTQTKNLPKWGVGYKVLLANMTTEYYGDCIPLEIRKTYDDINEDEIYDYCNNKYRAGYHIFTDMKGAEWWRISDIRKIIKVRYSKLTAIGTQRDHKVIVARRITILSEVSP